MWVCGWGAGTLSFGYGRVPAGKLQGQDLGDSPTIPGTILSGGGTTRTDMCSLAHGFPALSPYVFSVDTLL